MSDAVGWREVAEWTVGWQGWLCGCAGCEDYDASFFDAGCGLECEE